MKTDIFAGKPTKSQRKKKGQPKKSPENPRKVSETVDEKPSFAAVAGTGGSKFQSRGPIVPALPLTMERRRLS